MLKFKAKLKKPYKGYEVGSWYGYDLGALVGNQELRDSLDFETQALCSGYTCKDKEGSSVFLYEGDLVLFNYGDRMETCRVEFDHGCFGLGCKTIRGFDYNQMLEDGHFKHDSLMYIDHFITFLEIYWNCDLDSDSDELPMLTYIGNMQDNKELWYGEEGCN